MKTALIDFHCHLDLFLDPASAFSDAEAAGIYTLSVTTTPKAWPGNRDLTQGKRHVRAALGLHPQLVAGRATELKLWEEFLPQTRYVGEVGIDAGPRHYRSLDLQQQVFAHVLQKCAAAGGKILTVHSVRSAKIVLDQIETHFSRGEGQVVLHWFSGSKSELRRAVDLNCYFSINAAMMSHERGRSLVEAVPSDRLLTETDAPFTSFNNRPTAPPDVRNTVKALAALRRVGFEEMARAIESNLRTVLRGADLPVQD